jgi:hypothetical protein
MKILGEIILASGLAYVLMGLVDKAGYVWDRNIEMKLTEKQQECLRLITEYERKRNHLIGNRIWER